MPIIISLLIKFFLKNLVNSNSFLTIITWVKEFLAIKLANFTILNFKFLFSPAAYNGQITTRSDFLKMILKILFLMNLL